VFVQQKRIKTIECALDCAFDTEKRKQNIGMDGVQELLICKLKGPGGSSIQWGLLNSYDEVNPTSLFDYNVQPKKKQMHLFHFRKCDIKPMFIKV